MHIRARHGAARHFERQLNIVIIFEPLHILIWNFSENYFKYSPTMWNRQKCEIQKFIAQLFNPKKKCHEFVRKFLKIHHFVSNLHQLSIDIGLNRLPKSHRFFHF